MKRFYLRSRIALMTCALGMSGVYFASWLAEAWDEIPVVLPEASSGYVLRVVAKNPPPARRPCFREDANYDPDDCRKLEDETQMKILDGRDISKYAFGGRQGCFNVETVREQRKCVRSIERAYRFIWKHWTERKRAYVIVGAHSDDAASVAHIFVEPTGGSQMRIVWNWERVYGIASEPGEVDKSPDINSVTPKIATWEHPLFRPGSFYLELIDVNGVSWSV